MLFKRPFNSIGTSRAMVGLSSSIEAQRVHIVGLLFKLRLGDEILYAIVFL
jgi:hypothetical protein